jgi:L-threonylcarbamoyladenylate synthase
MNVQKKSNLKVSEVISVLKKGGLFIYPTETVYGIGADATNKKAVNKLNLYKKRPHNKPYSIVVVDKIMAEQYVELNKTADNLYEQFLPGPITVISKGKHKVAFGVESESGTLGIRIPNYKMIINIVRKFGKPITATSANASYQKRPYKISDILENISGKQKKLIDLIIDAGTLPSNEPSTVIDTTLDDDVVILRQGDIKLKEKTGVVSHSEENTQNIAKELWQKYEKYLGRRPIIFALEGPMGAGKTQFTKGLAKAMGINAEIVSPTFNLLLEYSVQGSKSVDHQLVHIDSWRMQNSDEMMSMGFNDILKNKNSVVSIEWAEKVIDVLHKHSEDTIIIWVKILYGSGINDRLINWGVI